jgi:hypothetical protein
MDGEDPGRSDGSGAKGDASLSRRDFLTRFASLSAAAVLLGVSTGCACSPVVYGPPPVAVYGPPPRKPRAATSTPEPTRTPPATGTPRVLYGPPPVGP